MFLDVCACVCLGGVQNEHMIKIYNFLTVEKKSNSYMRSPWTVVANEIQFCTRVCTKKCGTRVCTNKLRLCDKLSAF